MIDKKKKGSIGGVIIARGKPKYKEKNLLPVSICPLKIPEEMPWV
jgi:hypothetical protein